MGKFTYALKCIKSPELHSYIFDVNRRMKEKGDGVWKVEKSLRSFDVGDDSFVVLDYNDMVPNVSYLLLLPVIITAFFGFWNALEVFVFLFVLSWLVFSGTVVEVVLTSKIKWKLKKLGVVIK